jgi:hypothetical protein
VPPGDQSISIDWDCAPILVTDLPIPTVRGKDVGLEELGPVDDFRKAYAIPLPLKTDKGIVIQTVQGTIRLKLPQVPDVPKSDGTQVIQVEGVAVDKLFERMKCVWTRLREVEEVLADPAEMWGKLAVLWQNATSSRPKMDEIVRQARTLPPIVEKLDRAPRRILRRIHTQVVLSRVQELDRRSMTWLVRQPGDTIPQQAGDRQRIMAVAREENYDTLENRVLLAYARLARQTADDYAPKSLKVLKARHHIVRSFGKRCGKLASDLVDRGIRVAKPDVTPNFVLLNNSNYHEVWRAWRRLLEHRREWDKLWPWQARSWEEFCALAIMVALTQINGARAIATSPILFREEQRNGRWVDSINPFGVIHLTHQELIVEVQYGYKADLFRSWCAPVWLRIGRVDDPRAFLRRVPIWPKWSVNGGLLKDEIDELHSIVTSPLARQRGGGGNVDGALVIRPAGGTSDVERRAKAACVALGATGDALRDGIQHLRDVLSELAVGTEQL